MVFRERSEDRPKADRSSIRPAGCLSGLHGFSLACVYRSTCVAGLGSEDPLIDGVERQNRRFDPSGDYNPDELGGLPREQRGIGEARPQLNLAEVPARVVRFRAGVLLLPRVPTKAERTRFRLLHIRSEAAALRDSVAEVEAQFQVLKP